MCYKAFYSVTLVMALALSLAAENRDDWIDPNDMLNFDPSTNTMKKNKVEIPNSKLVWEFPPSKKQETEDDSSSFAQYETKSPESCPPCDTTPQSCPPCEGTGESCTAPVMCPDCKNQKECVCEQAGLPILRRYVTTLLNHIGDEIPGGEREDYTIHVSLSPGQMVILKKFSDEGNQKHIHDVHEILSTMIERIGTSRMGRIEKTIQLFEEKIGLKLDRLIQFAMLVALASCMLMIEVKLQIAWRRWITQLIVLMFLISIPWTWFELYKQAEIKQHSTASRPVPKECLSGEKDTLSALWSDLKSYFTLQNDRCHEYHEHLMIDPLIKVPPTQAIAVTFMRFFLAPVKDIGIAMSEFLRALLKDLPVTLYPVALLMVVLFLFMFLFMWFGYSIRLPFFLTIERSPQLSVADNQLHQAIKDTNERTLTQMKEMQERLMSAESEIVEKLKHMQQVQQAAIEYTVSAQPSSPVESPSLQSSEVRFKSGSPSRSEDKVTSQSRPEVKVTSLFPSRSEDKVKSGSPVKIAGKKPSSIPVMDISAASHSTDDARKG